MVQFDMCRKKRPAHVDERAVSKASCTKCSSCPAASAYKGIKNPPIPQENEWRKIAFNLFYVSAQNAPFVHPVFAIRSVTIGYIEYLKKHFILEGGFNIYNSFPHYSLSFVPSFSFVMTTTP